MNKKEQQKLDFILKRIADDAINFSASSLQTRHSFLYLIAEALEKNEKVILKHTMAEANFTKERAVAEFQRTCWQIRSYADHMLTGEWMNVRIDKKIAGDEILKTDIRKINIALGPVLVFGASNFPLAYSTAGGDTISALAAGCPVIVKAHPAHIKTSSAVAKAINGALRKSGLSPYIFTHLEADNKTTEYLVKHPGIAAIGFTGSFAGGKQFYDWAVERQNPIPVFAEMSSVNPVYLLPEKCGQDTGQLAKMLTDSITLGVGQYCTNPGILIGLAGKSWEALQKGLSQLIIQTKPAPMLNASIYKNYRKKLARINATNKIEIIALAPGRTMQGMARPALGLTTASAFITNPILQEEVFGPFSLMVTCKNEREMLHVAETMRGQLTSSIFGTTAELQRHKGLINKLQEKCGRLLCNAVPTGVQVSLAMQHGGPFPATTDSRFGAVGADNISRFCRPIAYQNWEEHLLPEPLRNKNSENILRVINNKLGRK